LQKTALETSILIWEDMNLRVIAISLAVVLFIIAVHQTINFGLTASYWAYSLSGLFFLGYLYLKRRYLEKNDHEDTPEEGKGKKARKGPKMRKRKYRPSKRKG